MQNKVRRLFAPLIEEWREVMRVVRARDHETATNLDVLLSASARAALDAGLESARADVASGRPATAWGDFTEYAVEDEEKDGA